MNFTCSAYDNLAVDSYTLLENGSAVNTNSLGVWSITMDNAGRFVYRCEANNSVGFDKSTDVIVNVEGELFLQRKLLLTFYMCGFSLPFKRFPCLGSLI